MYFLKTVTGYFSSVADRGTKIFQYPFLNGTNWPLHLILSNFFFTFSFTNFTFTNKNGDDILEKSKVRIFKISDYDFDEDERRAEFKDYDHVLCETCNQEIERNYYYRCENCFYNVTDINERRRMKFGKCKECLQINKFNECLSCNPKRFKKDFDKWTSGNEIIDKLIQDSQLSDHGYGILEWVPYNKLVIDKCMAKGGFAEVYSATWIDGPIKKWNVLSNNWKRDESTTVALKVLNSSKNISEELLNEIKFFIKVNEACLTKCYGITKVPNTQNYAFVLQYMKNGDLRSYLSLNLNSITWEQRLDYIYYICYGLNAIHEHNLIHRDLHPGNILYDMKYVCISDFGFCTPANENSPNSTEHVYGVLPYMAPEILRKKPYTQASDVYSLGIIINEMITAIPPFNDAPHDMSLALEICQGARPTIRPETPIFFKELIKKCWDANPEKRPTSKEILCELSNYFYTKQARGLDIIKLAKLHPQAIYKSRLLNLPPNLPEPKNCSNPQRLISSRNIIQVKTGEMNIPHSECLDCAI